MNPATGAGWRFLTKGQTAASALTALDSLLNGLVNLRGSSKTAILAVQNYLLWAENAEVQLRAYYRDRDVARGLHTERYWRIRSITDTTPRPHPLIAAEVDDQELSLTLLREQLVHYQGLLSPRASERFVILDTNVLIHGKQFHEVQWDSQFEEKDVRILMPLVIVDELDSLKNKSVPGAAGVLRDLDRFLPTDGALTLTQIRSRVRLQLIDEPLGHARLSNADDEIVQQASYFASISDAPVTIITQDRGMRVRAEAAGLDVLMLPGWLKRKEISDE